MTPTPIILELQSLAEPLMDQFQSMVEQAALQDWLNAVSGNSPFSVGVRDKRYQAEITAQGVIRRENSPGVRRSVFTGGPVAAQYEKGKDAFDLKPGLLAGPKAKVGKDGGRYNTVPFRHGVPSEDGGHFQRMPQEIERFVTQKFEGGGEPSLAPAKHFEIVAHRTSSHLLKQPAYQPGGFKPTITQVTIGPTGEKTYTVKDRGHRLTMIGEAADFGRQTKFIQPRSNFLISKSGKSIIFAGLHGTKHAPGKLPTYTWETSKYQGMIRSGQHYDIADQSHYMTFRRVSSNSDPNSWWHPGFKPRPIIQALVDHLQKTLPVLWENFMRNQS